jgi:hypothetical protein
VLGVRGGGWSAVVNERGSVTLDDGSPTLLWHVAADDRWHDPAKEPGVRQQRRAGVPVVETRVRIPGGDAVQRVYAVPDHGGLFVMEFSNESTLPIAIALTRPDIISMRSPSPVGPQGIDLPEGSVVFPVAHGSTLRVALCADGSQPAINLDRLPNAEQLQRGWLTSVEKAGWSIVPDKSLSPIINRLRSDALVLSAHPVSQWGDNIEADDIAFLLSVHELVRMGERVEQHIFAVVQAVENVLKAQRKAASVAWDAERALFAAQCVFGAMGETRAASDVLLSRTRLADVGALPNEAPTDIRVIGWLDEQLVSARRDGTVALLRYGIPRMWLGVNFECHDIVVSHNQAVSYGVRWHAERPALLWEVKGASIALDAGATDPTWSSTATSGETLLAGFLP